MNSSTFCVDRQTKEQMNQVKKRTRSGTFASTLRLLISLYEQMTEGMSRGTEIEFVEAIENLKAREFYDKLNGRKLDKVESETKTKKIKL